MPLHPAPPPEHFACHDCDLLLAAPFVEEGERVVCPRCGADLFARRPNTVHRVAALAVAAAVLFVTSNVFPFMTLTADYRESGMILSQSVSGLENQGSPFLAAAVGVFTLVAPALIIVGLLYLFLPLLYGRRLPGAIPLCRGVYEARRWNMVEVYLLGVLVSLLKLGKLATLSLGASFWTFVGLIICLTAALASIHPRELWNRLQEARR